MLFRKSRYATGGVMGVFCSSYSSLTVALRGPRPADGRPAEGIGSRKADVREMAESGVLSDTADGSETAERSSVADGGILGKFAVTGVDSERTGLTDMMATRLEILLLEPRSQVKQMTRWDAHRRMRNRRQIVEGGGVRERCRRVRVGKRIYETEKQVSGRAKSGLPDTKHRSYWASRTLEPTPRVLLKGDGPGPGSEILVS